jgi:hypothetical protein
MLTNVIYGFINMTHGQIFKQRTCPTHKCIVFAYKKARYHSTSSKCNGCSIQYLQASSLSLYSRGPKDWNLYSDTRAQNRVHSQIESQSDRKAATVFNTIRKLTEPDCYTGPGNFSAQRPSTWQKAGEYQNRSSLNIVLIDCLLRKSFKFISFWFRIKLGKQALKGAT